jgi:hypothetical protein
LVSAAWIAGFMWPGLGAGLAVVEALDWSGAMIGGTDDHRQKVC